MYIHILLCVLCGGILYYLLGLLHDVCFLLCVLWLCCISKCIHPCVYCTVISPTSYFQRSTAHNFIWEPRSTDQRTGVLTGILLTIQVFCYVEPCRLVCSYRHFEGPLYLQLHGRAVHTA